MKWDFCEVILVKENPEAASLIDIEWFWETHHSIITLTTYNKHSDWSEWRWLASSNQSDIS
jgi:hypothetical protein